MFVWTKGNTSEGHPSFVTPELAVPGEREEEDMKDGYQHFPNFALGPPSPPTSFSSVLIAPLSGSGVIFLDSKSLEPQVLLSFWGNENTVSKQT